jgi:membrane protein YdbS with pleckstrin-like domain
LLQIKNLRLFTAGGSGNLRIAGLDEEQAETLRAILETRTRKV